MELAARIEQVLTGASVAEAVRLAPPRRPRRGTTEPLNLDTVITEHYTNSKTKRAFFESVIGPSFHFTTNFMRFCRENVGKTYRDPVAEWHREQESKKSDAPKEQLPPQFQYTSTYATTWGTTLAGQFGTQSQRGTRRSSAGEPRSTTAVTWSRLFDRLRAPVHHPYAPGEMGAFPISGAQRELELSPSVEHDGMYVVAVLALVGSGVGGRAVWFGGQAAAGGIAP